ncbi:tetratricopeptide repeat protein [sulfur-oxidizing endosymbiont of Gigantopelta aegis]|uniref:tetratricopeptide repeat protein n=1 Tax=sulfur-oxidizing endosymbiont of Gigantopelta aegis TaxID=2794934 RepID=UPI0018DCD844|nr:tetratricopeptide repeat protein [sulfur-oxidizing endosymbiont of Gigantopelta aegis]
MAEDDFERGAFYFSQGNYLEALSLWAPLAEQGNPVAQYSIGLLYEQGKGVKKDARLALKYFESAVAQNLPAAQYYLGMKYYAGLDIKRDVVKARQLLKKSAQNDYLQAQFQLASLYNKGIGGAQDARLATHWFSQAAESGYGPAQHSLATRYLTGKGVSLNLSRGIFWLEKAADQSNSDALRDLGFMYIKGMGVEQDFQKAHDLLLIPAEEGSGLALFLLGEIYSTGGHGIKKSTSQAKKWFRLAQKAGYQDARLRLQQLSKSLTPPSLKEVNQARTHKPLNKNLTKQHQSSTANLRLEHDTLRFKKLDDDHYVLQLLSANQYSSISHLTDQYIDEASYILQLKQAKKTSFVLLYGHYKSYTNAKQAIAQLPAVFQLKSTPWIRKVKNIKRIQF